ncbi:NADPH:quinone reductase [Marchantia polymorpha subsp. ruderalis]|uniref:Enoyl reductase (ER) domain-containing protein n=2 Tax=Marchantia polymorpha TaxID=3197 RepID=A0A176VRH3_MARPO|nr:hypothetical protein AXG93_620s1240 [Marchantia polymorpha subsp. ruderalis]PTQ48364.1 hypothetical protein MARPO_0005s0036 [Marchantia polymorpha]BBM97439.1 hypothetical protein Mp_1g05710 [Marchantia polymorpha subsp. ruderalis]|eukprot:PTQ48364.1 hypothetical protein MARPO_0005s0036 [Marchantia polymorpha]
MRSAGGLRSASQWMRKTVGNMKAVVITQPGGPDVLQLKDVEEPSLGSSEVLIKVAATAVNRADTLQRQGKYPPPAGASLYPGLECSGVVEAVGDRVQRWKVGDEVCALLAGGGYAEKINVPEGQVLPVPKGVSLLHAAALPEVSCTVWSTVFMTSKLTAGESFLVHGGSSGIGTFAIQIAKAKGAKVFCTVGNQEKADCCRKLGADVVINYKEQDFVQVVKEETGNKGVNVILDHIGASYFQKNVDALSVDGRLFIIGFMGGAAGQVNLAPVMLKRLTVQGAGLRSRSLEQKSDIVAEVLKHVWPEVESGKVKPVVHSSFPLGDACKGHELLESSAHVGKIILTA